MVHGTIRRLKNCPSWSAVEICACAVVVTATLPPEPAVQRRSSTIVFCTVANCLIAWSKRPVARFRNKSLSKASSGLVPEANSSFYYPLSSRQWVSLLAAFVVWMYGERVREACVQRNDPSIFTVFNVLGMGRMTEAIAINHDFRHEDV